MSVTETSPSATETSSGEAEERELIAAAQAGDEAAFSAVVKRHRRELQLHCYRMVGSLEDAEDLTQETFLRAWSKRASFEGRSSFRAWLYRIATNASLDALERRRTRAGQGEGAVAADADGSGPAFEVPWLQPYPDRLLEGVEAPEHAPDAKLVAKETIELAFLTAIQQLPHRQRAALLLRGLVGFSAKESAAMLETSVPSVNSALQRARAALRDHLPERRTEWTAAAEPSAEERELVQRYVEASEQADADAFAELMRADARFAMPPEPETVVGAEAIIDAWKRGGFGDAEFGDFRCALTRANGQVAVACYLRKPGWGEYRPLALDVLRIEGALVSEIIAFPLSPAVIEAAELPATL